MSSQESTGSSLAVDMVPHAAREAFSTKTAYISCCSHYAFNENDPLHRGGSSSSSSGSSMINGNLLVLQGAPDPTTPRSGLSLLQPATAGNTGTLLRWTSRGSQRHRCRRVTMSITVGARASVSATADSVRVVGEPAGNSGSSKLAEGTPDEEQENRTAEPSVLASSIGTAGLYGSSGDVSSI